MLRVCAPKPLLWSLHSCCSGDTCMYSRPPQRCRFWRNQFLAVYNSFPGSDEPSIGINYDGRLFQVLGPDNRCGGGCWGMKTTIGYIQVNAVMSQPITWRPFEGCVCVITFTSFRMVLPLTRPRLCTLP